MSEAGLKAAELKMREAGQAQEAIAAFRAAYERLVAGEAAMLPSAELEPVSGVATLASLGSVDEAAALEHVAVIKLNGGLATTMGLSQPKSLVIAREGRSFLEIIVGQTVALRRRLGVALPLVLMDSEATRERTMRMLAEHPELEQDVPLDFPQAMIPKLEAERLEPVRWPAAPALEWCPPGHGDVFGALGRSGLLGTLRSHGVRYAMISNADNLGATPDARIAALLAAEQIPFLMEVVEGTEADRKGGHIARRRSDGALVLRETAQTPPEDADSFRDFARWRYYNTNNLWVDLRVLEELLEGAGGVLELPLIVNPKTVDPRDAASTPVLQLESAMGAAIERFAGARIVCVPRTRFVPVKGTEDLLVLRSDVYTLSPDLLVEPVPERAGKLPFVELDAAYYRLLADFEARFPHGAPSLREAERLIVRGDVTFGADVRVRGAVELEAGAKALRIEDGALLVG